MNHTPSRPHPSTGSINDRTLPRWQIGSIACAIFSGGQWHDVTLMDISLSGVKVRGHWDRALPVTAVSLADAGPSVTGALLILQADPVWMDADSAMTALCFDIPDHATAANLLKFLASHIAAGPSR